MSDKSANKSARILVRVDPARGKLNGEVAGHADIVATILARKSARMSASVSVSVRGISALRSNIKIVKTHQCSLFLSLLYLLLTSNR